MENGIYLVTIEISKEWKRVPRKWNVVYLVEGNNIDFPGSGNEFPGSGKSYLPVNR